MQGDLLGKHAPANVNTWFSANVLLAEASNDIVNGKVWASQEYSRTVPFVGHLGLLFHSYSLLGGDGAGVTPSQE